MTKSLLFTVLLVAGLASAVPARAGLFLPPFVDSDYPGDTSNGGSFNRPVANGDLPPDTLSDFADSVLYDVVQFEVTSSGIYSFFVTPNEPAFWSTYLFLYQNSFDPADPLANVVLGESNDDSTSNFTVTLYSGLDYFAVVTGFSNFDFGTYNDHITELQVVVPEPGTAFLLSLCASVLAIPLIRRRAAARN